MAKQQDTDITLGFAEKIESWKLRCKFFPSKVGGFPSWLNLESLPAVSDLQCKKCKKPLLFLCQIYAPIVSKEDCFHRTLFVFICKDGKCNSANDSSNLEVFRCQLPRSNKFYSFHPPEEKEEESDDPNVSLFTKICRICGCSGPKTCGHCKLVSYCSRDHQLLDWKDGHKLECNSKCLSTSGRASKTVVFPEYEIDLEPEEIDPEVKEKNFPENGQQSEEEKLQNYNVDGGEYNEEELMKMANKETDQVFASFRSRINHFPEQIVRYQMKGKPLFVSADSKPTSISNCEYCGAERVFEFQIMPQMLVYLNVDSVNDSIDWGTIIVYTCAESCSPKNTSYLKEICFKQDYT
ncbi:Programmed cell death protein 2 [Armadillidium nasatum]|uniref:Programmed cell death protein 2 n=1 Tax=Armadillidium nasatum TaxID=96803 RepID=A0A5N5TBM5_9CRUS|nr:Programmed cell death protein 2 [Armadillidium nasatum]